MFFNKWMAKQICVFLRKWVLFIWKNQECPQLRCYTPEQSLWNDSVHVMVLIWRNHKEGSRPWSPGLRAAVERAWGPFFGAMEQFNTLRLRVQEFRHAIHIPRTEHQNGECVEKPGKPKQRLCLVMRFCQFSCIIYCSHSKVVWDPVLEVYIYICKDIIFEMAWRVYRNSMLFCNLSVILKKKKASVSITHTKGAENGLFRGKGEVGLGDIIIWDVYYTCVYISLEFGRRM